MDASNVIDTILTWSVKRGLYNIYEIDAHEDTSGEDKHGPWWDKEIDQDKW